MKPLLIGCVLTILLACLGGIIGYGWYLSDLEPDDTWKPLGAPPTKAVHLLAVRSDTVYVQTANQKIYSCYRPSQYERSCWNLSETIPEDLLGGDPIGFSPLIPPRPNNVQESLAVRYIGPGMAHHFSMSYAYILLSDGTVMQWTDSPEISYSHFLNKTFAGFIVGFLLCPIFYLIRSRHRNTHKLIKYG